MLSPARKDATRATSSPKYVARKPPDTFICSPESCTDSKSTSKRVPHGSASGFSRRTPRQRIGKLESIILDSIRLEARFVGRLCCCTTKARQPSAVQAASTSTNAAISKRPRQKMNAIKKIALAQTTAARPEAGCKAAITIPMQKAGRTYSPGIFIQCAGALRAPRYDTSAGRYRTELYYQSHSASRVPCFRSARRDHAIKLLDRTKDM